MPTMRPRPTLATLLRIVVGSAWIIGAVVNAAWTMRHLDLYQGFALDSPLAVYRWFFGEIVSAHPAVWTILLVAGELAVGVLTLSRGRWARLGLVGGTLWSVLLFPLLWPSTLMMGPYAVFLAWLAGQDHETSVLAAIRGWLEQGPRRDEARVKLPQA